jgi:hypothetical protein
MRSDQRRPPRATLPPRRCTPSTRGEYTKISNMGRGSGRPGTFAGSSLNDSTGFGLAGRVALEEVGAQGGLHQREVLAQDAVLVEVVHVVQRGGDARDDLRFVCRAIVAAPGRSAAKEPTSSAAMPGCAASACSM